MSRIALACLSCVQETNCTVTASWSAWLHGFAEHVLSLVDVGFSELQERAFNEAKADISRQHHQKKEDRRPKARQIEIGNVHDPLIHKPGSVKHDKKVEQIDGVRIFPDTPDKFGNARARREERIVIPGDTYRVRKAFDGRKDYPDRTGRWIGRVLKEAALMIEIPIEHHERDDRCSGNDMAVGKVRTKLINQHAQGKLIYSANNCQESQRLDFSPLVMEE